VSAPDQRSEAAIAAFNAGYLAFENGEPRLVFAVAEDLDEKLHGDWLDGWDKAERDYWKEIEMDEQDIKMIRRYE
jgi:hypothetical protein